MDINFEKGTVTLFGKVGKFDTLIRKFAMLSGEQAYHFLINRGIQLPRRMNCLALMSVLNQRIKFLNSRSLSKDYFTRLQYYTSFSEQQLYNLFNKICNDPDSFYAYRYNLFKLILTNFVAMDFSDGELSYVKNLKKAQVEPFEQYFNYISGAAIEQEDTFDGQDKDLLFKSLEFSASNQEIIDMAGKYGIEIPQSLKKEDYLEFIFWYMQKNNTYNDEVAEGLKEMTISQLDIFTLRMNIPMSSTLSKKDLITYLAYILENGSFETTSIRRFEIPDEYKPFIFTVDLDAVSVFGNGKAKKVIHYEGESSDKDEFKQVLIAEEEAIKEAKEEEKRLAEEEALKEAQRLEEEKTREQAAALDAIPEQDEPEEDYEDGEYEFVEAVYEDANAQNNQEEQQEEQAEATEEVVEEVVEEPADGEEEVVNVDQVEEVEAEPEEGPIILDEDLSDVESASDDEIAELLKENNMEPEKEEEEAPKDPEFRDSFVVENELYGSDKIMKMAKNTTAKTVVISICLGLCILAAIIFLIIVL